MDVLLRVLLVFGVLVISRIVWVIATKIDEKEQ